MTSKAKQSARDALNAAVQNYIDNGRTIEVLPPETVDVTKPAGVPEGEWIGKSFHSAYAPSPSDCDEPIKYDGLQFIR